MHRKVSADEIDVGRRIRQRVNLEAALCSRQGGRKSGALGSLPLFLQRLL